MQGNAAMLAKPPIDLSGVAPGVAADWLIAKYWDDAMPILPGRIAQRLGIRLVYLRATEQSQVCTDDQGRVCIAFKECDTPHIQRFTIAHVLGHIVLGHGFPPLEAWGSFGNNAPDPRDRAANQFAATLLVPTDALRWCFTSGWMASLERIVEAFDVPESVVLYRYDQWRRSR
ncbi:ImmA/IrrE family metallo-endopeptidase [Mitsuaria sp. GD03876]|uniref:ImmA/IrrE family metallo-endopeptidase n=1 Tax=Mitsuaria sp. GD03876 TaxID=2975399 RepID=UPI00244C55FB|nr:ImmA/IrrE family metallo-endopeptidase [Mitsuaria sp. GD03876]MDH0863613.1 ImmA/IrrE family metallo-endopeptidase [Mitsuaria sp. GD03876]